MRVHSPAHQNKENSTGKLRIRLVARVNAYDQQTIGLASDCLGQWREFFLVQSQGEIK